MDKKRTYLSYLLRIWQVDRNGGDAWLASLEHPGSGQRQGFRNLKHLFSYLEEQTGEAADESLDVPGKDDPPAGVER